MGRKYWRVVLMFVPFGLLAQEKNGLQQILDRLEQLEQANRSLAAEVRALRTELAGSRSLPPTPETAAQNAGAVPAPGIDLEERVAVQERRAEEMAQTKIEASQKWPIQFTGMALFNSFLNGSSGGGQQDPTAAARSNNPATGGGTLRQSIIGFTYQGPRVLGEGQVSGALYMDLWGGTSNSLNNLVRLRVAHIGVDWKNTSLMLGQDKPILSPREPFSLAQVAVSPLTGAGNLWLWQPQMRVERRFAIGENAGIKARAGIYQTSESASSAGTEYAPSLAPARPALQGRVEVWRSWGEHRRIEIAPGFHASTTHVAGTSVPSRLWSVDWLIQPLAKVQFTGMFFQGRNAAGLGGLRQGFTIFGNGKVAAVHATGGWAQLSLEATRRLSFNIHGGQEGNRAEDLGKGGIQRNFAYASNVIYRLGSNVLVGLEASQVRTNYLGNAIRHNNHYDLALAYLF